MKTYLECIPCFFKQALDTARLAKADEVTQKKVLDEVAKVLPGFYLSSSPPEMGKVIHSLIKQYTGTEDPFKRIKQKSNELALSKYDTLKEKVKHSADPLLTAIELAIAGNIIDYGVKHSIDVDKEIQNILEQEDEAIREESRQVFNYQEFKSTLQEANEILYLADNAGEVVFDRVLIEHITENRPEKHFYYVVKQRPIINDALAEDAYSCGLDKTADIISSGSDGPGTLLSLCSKEFLKKFEEADMVISKGQGNFEALWGTNRPVCFLFMAKCPVVAGHIGCNIKDIILMKYTPHRVSSQRA